MGFFQALMCSVGFLPWWYIGSDSFYYSFPVMKKKQQNKHKPLACQHQREKNHLPQLYHNRSKQAASDFPVKKTRQKRKKNLPNVNH